MQNKANFKKVKFYATYEMTRTYEKWTLGVIGKTKPNKANSKPIKANLKNAKMNVTKEITKDYEKMSSWAIYENKPNFDPKQTQFHTRLSLYEPFLFSNFLSNLLIDIIRICVLNIRTMGDWAANYKVKDDLYGGIR
jgi:hypothetical protein